MKKWVFLQVLFVGGIVLAELPIPATTYRKAPLATVQQDAEGGSAEAQLELALRFYAGHQVEKDWQQALQWMQLSADQAHPEAFTLLSRMYAEGIGGGADAEKAEFWFAKALAMDPDNSELQLQYMQYLSDGRNPESFLKKCADAGYAPALLDIGLPAAEKLYLAGQIEDAVPLFQQLDENGSAEGAYYLARVYDLGQGGLQPDPVEAFLYYKKASEGGHAPAQLELARMYAKGRGTVEDPEQAEFWYRQAAGNGYAEAQVQVAEIAFSKAVEAEAGALEADAGSAVRNEYEKQLRQAVIWYKAAAAQHHADALYMMGRLTASGEGVRKDYEAAVRYYEEAAGLGHAESVFYLGLMYQAGLGVAENVGRAVELYQQAAEKGVTGALYYLANCYRFGVGVQKQPVRGEAIYYGKILKDFVSDVEEGDEGDAGREISDSWVLAAAREYAVIRWRKASVREKFIEAAGWAGMAAQNGDVIAQDIFLKMNERTRRSYRDGERDSHYEAIFEHPAQPETDAVAKKRSPFFFPYVLRDVDDLYARSDVQENIVFVQTQGAVIQNVAGDDDLQELYIVYRRPPTRYSVGFSGILLIGVEFENYKTGEKYWSFCERHDDASVFSSGAYIDLSVFMDVTSYPNLRVTDWSVVYGHLLEKGAAIAVFDSKDKSKSTGGLPELFLRNRYSKKIENTAVATIDLRRMSGPDDLLGDPKNPEDSL